jgi:hypothetical protein
MTYLNPLFQFGCVGCCLLSTIVNAEQLLPVPPPPPIASPEELVGAAIRIIEQEQQTIYEYRVRGQLQMVKIVPKIGAPYYLVDANGDGLIDKADADPDTMAVQQWLLFEW